MTPQIFIDGDVGTTGLQIKSRLEGRVDIELLSLNNAIRKNPEARAEMLNRADISILCLPDDAAIEAVSMVTNPDVRLIDASTAHRVADGWVYGFPEYNKTQSLIISKANRVSNPGCYALTSISILHPLVQAGLLPVDWPISINAISGYSGGGKGMISQFEEKGNSKYTEVPFFAYGLSLEHKHLPEITLWSGISHPPLFVPSVGRYAQGMIVQVPLHLRSMQGGFSAVDVHEVLDNHYSGQKFVSIAPLSESKNLSKLEPQRLNGSNQLRLYVFTDESEEQVVVAGLLDNLGKGASGQAIQNLNLMLGIEEETGL